MKSLSLFFYKLDDTFSVKVRKENYVFALERAGLFYFDISRILIFNIIIAVYSYLSYGVKTNGD